MNLDRVIVDGTLKADGALELHQKPNLPPGRVIVIVRPAPASPPQQRTRADVIGEIHQGQQARGFQGRSAEEIEAGLQDGGAEYERRMQALRP